MVRNMSDEGERETMKSNRECPPRPTGEISFTTGKPKPPEPPPMRCVRTGKPKEYASIWDAHWFEILAIFIAGWWIGTFFH